MRKKFNEIFRENEDGTLTPNNQTVNIGGVVFGPGISFGPGMSFSGIDIYKYKNYELDVEETNGVLVIKGYYKNEYK